MQYSQNILIHVVCEGKSERNYIEALNRLLRDNGANIPLVLYPQSVPKGKEVGGGHFSHIVETYRKEKKRNPKQGEIWIWVDWDAYMRNDRDTTTLYQRRPSDIPEFLFSYQNFEDFLILHCTPDRVKQWVAICNAHGHIEHPLHSAEYIPLFRQLFPEYEKGKLPDRLAKLSEEDIGIALQNSLDDTIPFKCDFIERLARFISERFSSVGAPWTLVKASQR